MIHSHIWELFNFGLQSHKFDWHKGCKIVRERKKMVLTIKYSDGRIETIKGDCALIDGVISLLRRDKKQYHWYIIKPEEK